MNYVQELQREEREKEEEMEKVNEACFIKETNCRNI